MVVHAHFFVYFVNLESYLTTDMLPGMPKFPGEDFINSFYPILIALVLGLILGFSFPVFRNYMRGPKCPSQMQMNNKIVIITGANSGIGFETAKNLVLRGAEVIMACRDETKAVQVVDDIKKSLDSVSKVTFMKLDLSSLQSVRDFAATFTAKYSHCDVLINNAGVMCHPQATTGDNYELHFQTNYLGHFLLTHLLLDKLKSAPGGGRVISVMANAYRLGEVMLDDLHFEKREYKPGEAYAQSKLAVLLFTRKLSHHLQSTKVTVNAVSPGVVRTDIHRHMPFKQSTLVSLTFAPFMWFLMKTASDGAQTVIYCATATELDGVSGKCFGDCREMELEAVALDDDTADKLWDRSFQLCDIPIPH